MDDSSEQHSFSGVANSRDSGGGGLRLKLTKNRLNQTTIARGGRLVGIASTRLLENA